jgi:diguanylate cyclase (GGDEF)-like protein
MPSKQALLLADPLPLLEIAGEFLTASVFLGIAFAIVVLITHTKTDIFKRYLILVAVFFALCGLTATLGVFKNWYDVRLVLLIAKVVAGVLAVSLVFHLWRLLPKIKALPTTAKMEKRVEELEKAAREQLEINTALAEKFAKRAGELELLASTDPLTNLLNRREILETLKVELERADRLNSELSVLMLDLDHFKKINDTYGHQMGDAVLVAAANILTETSRKTDFIGRIGGEEFVAIFPNTDYASAMILAERYRENIENAQLDDIRFTCSIGLAEREQDEQRDNLMLRADRALYQSKNTGRNKVS